MLIPNAFKDISRRPTITLLAAIVFAWLALAPLASAQHTVYSCWADCNNCGYPSNPPPGWDCTPSSCSVIGETVSCHFGCCLDVDLASCFSFSNGRFQSIYIDCGLTPPGGWLTEDPETFKLYQEAGPCLDIGVSPPARADGHADWVLVEMAPAAQLTADDVHILASSSGIQALLPDLEPEVLAARVGELRADVDKTGLDQSRGGVMVGVYPPLQSRTIRLDLSSLDGRKVAVESAEALVEIELTAKGEIREVRALYWDDKSAIAALLPLFQGKIALDGDGAGLIDDAGLKALDRQESLYALVYLVFEDSAVASALAYGYQLNR